jgi:hypothetical protein
MPGHRVFLLSPASCGGKRAALLFNERASFPLALRLRTAAGAPLGDVFSFLSGLYFRGKLTYATAFARAPKRAPGAMIITSSRGLLDPATPIGIEDLREFADVPIESSEPRYAEPLARDARDLANALGPRGEVVLLGSVASDKYVDILGEVFGSRLLFPGDFVGRGDMSRGGLMLRCVREERELDYIAVAGAIRRGSRPPRLVPIRARRSRPGRAP